MSRYGEPIGIAGDATVYCLPCARKAYGRWVVNSVLGGATVPDGEGNDLAALLVGQDVADEPDKLQTCDVCGSRLDEWS
jgi:hypothetical protein